jgi:hypothetical protein
VIGVTQPMLPPIGRHGACGRLVAPPFVGLLPRGRGG